MQVIGELSNHLWQSTLFACAAGLVTVPLRANQARVRYWLWFSASCKFLVPFALLMSMGAPLPRAPATPKIVTAPAVASAIIEISQPFSDTLPLPSTRGSHDAALIVIFGIWSCGFVGIAVIRFRGWLHVRAAVRCSTAMDISSTVEVRSSAGLIEPGVVGFWRPILLLPAGLIERLTTRQLEAVLAHEVCHVQRRDNLTSLIHMIVEALFWFHPITWWIGARLIEERERACDEAVLSRGGEPHDYAEAILNVCKLYVESPLQCISGIAGSNLKRRIQEIMAGRIGRDLQASKKIALAMLGVAALAAPIIVGSVRAQSTAPRPEFEVASVKPSAPNTRFMIRTLPGGGIFGTYVPLKRLIATAYSITDFQIFGNSKLLGEQYDLTARAPHPTDLPQLRLMLQSLLEERFNLKFHRETRDLPIYSLVVAKKGPAEPSGLEKNPGGDCSVAVTPQDSAPDGKRLPACGNMNIGYGRIFGRRARISQLADRLSTLLGRTVLDKTDLAGIYNVELTFTPDPTMGEPPPGVPAPDPLGPSIFEAIQQQLGLRLQAGRGPVEVIVIESAHFFPN